MKKGAISRNIGFLMEHFGIRNESQLAKQVGMPQTTVNKLIAGVSADPRISTLIPIAEHFKISLDTLLSENPMFGATIENEPAVLWIPLIAQDEVADVYGNLDSLNTANWPHWYPIPKQKHKDYYAIHLTSELLSPFDEASILIIEKKDSLENNTYCMVKHLNSNSINIKKAFFENGQQWLLALQSELPASEFNKKQWELLGTIRASVIDITNGDFIPLGEQG